MEHLDVIKSGLIIKAEEAVAEPKQAWEEPYVKTKAPSGFPYKERTLVDLPEVRKLKPTMDAMVTRIDLVKEVEEKTAAITVAAKEKNKEIEEKAGYDIAKSELTEMGSKISEQLIGELEQSGAQGKEILNYLYRYNNTLVAVEEITKQPNINVSYKDAVLQAAMKFVSPEIAGEILKGADEYVKTQTEALKKAGATLSYRFDMWPTPKDVEKKVKKQEVASKTAGIFETIIGLFESVKDAVAGFFAATEKADPIMEELEELIATEGM